MTESHVPTGYELGRDERGLTNQERRMRSLLLAGNTVTAAAKEIDVSRQRGHQLAKALVEKGSLTKEGGKYVARSED